MTEHPYSGPVQRLLQLGEHKLDPWLDYTAMGLDSAHIPELIQLVQDEDLRWVDIFEESEEVPSEYYAQIHAWRALGQLKAEQSIPALIGILHQVDDYDDDWTGEELVDVLAMIGPAAIPALSAYLTDTQNKTYARATASGALNQMAVNFPETRDACVSALAAALETYEQNDEDINAFIISDLVDLKAVEYIGLIEQAFQAGKVEEFLRGDFEDIQVDLGLLEKRKSPPRVPGFLNSSILRRRQELLEQERNAARIKAKKEKAKRKQAKISQKKNRKKKK